MINEEVLRIGTTRKLAIRKSQMEFLWHIMRNEALENLILRSKRNSGQRESPT